MKKVILMTVAVLVVLTVSSCRKETEKIIERVEVQKGNQILSGIGAPAENIGNVGDYYLDLSNTNLYGAKTKQGWGTPINLKGIQGDKGEKGDKGDTGDTGQKGEKGEKGDTGATGQKGDKGDRGEKGVVGQDGSKIYAGTTAPTNSVGKAGDWYIDTLSKRLYGPKTNTGWSNNYVELGGSSSTAPSIPIEKDDYTLSPDKRTLVSLNSKIITHIDMNSNEDLREIEHIGEDAFLAKEKIVSVILGNKVKTIGEDAFSGCTSLASITLPITITNIGGYAFKNCKTLHSIRIPEGVTSIQTCTFEGCESLYKVYLPNSITSIGWMAFDSCESLKTISLPNNITTIEKYAFEKSGLTSITLPEKLTFVEEKTFYSCKRLTSLTISKNVESFAKESFAECTNLTIVICEAINPPMINTIGYYGVSGSKAVFKNTPTNKTLFVPAESLDSYKKSFWSNSGEFGNNIKAKP